MNGLLHRMAARAAGTAALVRADVGLTQGGPVHAPVDLVRFDAGDAGDAVGRQALPAPEAMSALRPLSMAAAKVAGDASVVPATAAAPLDPLQAADREPLPSPPAAMAGDESRLAQRSAPWRHAGPAPAWAEDAFADDAERLDAALPAAPSARTVPPPALIPAPLATAPHRVEHGHRPALDIEPARALRGSAEPPPLLPPGPSPAPLAPASSIRRAGAPAAAATAPATDTEVHIHIGRIDVTAVHEPAAPRRRAPAAPAPMSLGDYLAQRARS